MGGRREVPPPAVGGVAMDRLSPLDASFLHLEDDVNHMHIGSASIFEGPPPGYDEFTGTVAGRRAMVSKVHHCLVDGVSGAELLAVLLDVSPEVPAPVSDGWHGARAPSPVRLARDAVVDLATSPYEQLRAAGVVVRRPRRPVDALREVVT